jgi:hypothetical protein
MELNKISYHDVDLLFICQNIIPQKLDEKSLASIFSLDSSNQHKILSKDIQFNFIMADQPFVVCERVATDDTIVIKLISYSIPVLLKSNECYFIFEGTINKNCILRTTTQKPIIIQSCMLTLFINLLGNIKKYKKYFYNKNYYSKYKYSCMIPIQRRPSLNSIYEKPLVIL